MDVKNYNSSCLLPSKKKTDSSFAIPDLLMENKQDGETWNALKICKIGQNFVKWIGHYFCPNVLSGLCVKIACSHFTWPLWGRFEICVVSLFVNRNKFKNAFVTRQTKQIKGVILKHSRNIERKIEHIRHNGMSEGSCEWWIERNVKWKRKVGSENWRKTARWFWNITGTLRANIDVSI
jgi:hypothetical protein